MIHVAEGQCQLFAGLSSFVIFSEGKDHRLIMVVQCIKNVEKPGTKRIDNSNGSNGYPSSIIAKESDGPA